MQKYLRVEFFHEADTGVYGDYSKTEAYKLIAQQQTPVRIVIANSREYLKNNSCEIGEEFAEFSFKTATYYTIPLYLEYRDIRGWDVSTYRRNFDFSAHHILGKHFDSSLLEDGIKIVSKLPASITPMPLPKINMANIIGY